MRTDQVTDVDVIAYTGDVVLGPKPERGLLSTAGCGTWDRRRNIEVAQNAVTEIMSRCGVAEDDSRHQLGPAIRRDRCSQRLLDNRHLRRIAIDRCSP